MRRPIYWDDTLTSWVASSAESVTAVLTSEHVRVRPPAEPVPLALLDSPAAFIFRHLVRMNDGEWHRSLKPAVSATLREFNLEHVSQQSQAWAGHLAVEMELHHHSERLADFAFSLPVYVIASLLGNAQEQLAQTAGLMSAFVRCLAPGSLPAQIEQGKSAALHLLDLMRASLSMQQAAHRANGLGNLALEVGVAGIPDPDVAIANGIGLLSQAYEATAGLIGNSVLALARHPDVYDQILVTPDRLRFVIQEVLRYDPPVQNTRRYLAGNATIAGQTMKSGDSVLVVLAAANRNLPDTLEHDRFDVFRQHSRHYAFGVGAHACPGEMIAVTIARAGVEQIIRSGVAVSRLAENFVYRPSTNTRIPLFRGGNR